MPYTKNTSGTTGDGILAALGDLANGTDNRPYVTNTSGVTLNALLTVLTDIVAGSVTDVTRNTSGTLLDLAVDAVIAIRDGDSVPAFNAALYGTTLAGFVARLVDVANGMDSSPYPALNTAGVTLNGWIEALDEAIANGTIGVPHLTMPPSSVAEDASNGTVIGTVSIAGAYTGTPAYSLANDEGGKVAINSSTGVITKANAIDFEATPTLLPEVAVTGVSPSVANRSFTINVTDVVEDTTPPAIFSLYPADDATSVSVASSLVITFDEDVVSSGALAITIHDASDDSVVQAFDDTDIGTLVTIAGAVVTITPSVFDAGIDIYVQVDGIEDLAGNAFAGILDQTTWNFTVASGPPPAFVPTYHYLGF